MKKTIFFYIAFLITSILFSQNGEVIYRITPPKDISHYIDTIKLNQNEIARNALSKLFQKTRTTSTYLKYSLSFQDSISNFTMEKLMEPDNGMDIEIATTILEANGLYFTDLKKGNNLHQFDSRLGETLIIQTKIKDIKWEIKEDTRIIKGYTCQKAVADIRIPGIKKGKITAWFCPELPFQFGPMEFAGLPGLILGLEQRGFYFHATEVKLDKKNRKITKPTNGELLTAEEYYDSIKGFIEKVKQR